MDIGLPLIHTLTIPNLTLKTLIDDYITEKGLNLQTAYRLILEERG